MNFAQIRYFLVVCEVRNFTQAAAICGISQPSLSVAIRRLEEELGGPLFDRGPPAEPSALGDAVKPRFKIIAREIGRLQRIAGISPECASDLLNDRKRGPPTRNGRGQADFRSSMFALEVSKRPKGA